MRRRPNLPCVDKARLGVFLLDEAGAIGWSVDQLVRAVRRDEVVRVRRGAYAPPCPPDTSKERVAEITLARQAIAVSLVNRAAIVSHLAGATARGWPTWGKPRARPCVVVPVGNTGVEGLHVHRLLGRRGDFVRRGDLRLTSAVRTITDIACEFGARAGLVSADFALAHDGLSRADLADAVEAADGRRGVSGARLVLELVDPAAESPLESLSRWEMHVHDVSPPLSQVEIYDLDGAFLGRVDFYWPDGVVGEVDGSVKYTDLSVLWREKWRQENVERTRLRVVRWGAVDLRQFAATARRIEAARREACADGREPGWIAVKDGEVIAPSGGRRTA